MHQRYDFLYLPQNECIRKNRKNFLALHLTNHQLKKKYLPMCFNLLIIRKMIKKIIISILITNYITINLNIFYLLHSVIFT